MQPKHLIEAQQGRLYEHKLQDGKNYTNTNQLQGICFVVTQNNELRIGSGHYVPTIEEGMQLQRALESTGVKTKDAWLELYKFDYTKSGYVIDTGTADIKIKLK